MTAAPFDTAQEARIREIIREALAARDTARRDLFKKFSDLRESVALSKRGGTEDAQ